MARTRKIDLENVTARLARKTSESLQLDFSYGRPRLMRLIDAESGAVEEISPRLAMGDMLQWMYAFEEGLDFIEKIAREKAYREGRG